MTASTHPEHSAGSARHWLRTWLGVTGRAIVILVLIAGSGLIAWSFSQAFMGLAVSVNPAFSTGIAFGSILALGMFCASQIEKLKALAGEALIWIKGSVSGLGEHGRARAGYIVLEACLIAFPICLAIQTVHRVAAHEMPPIQSSSGPEIHFVHAVHYRHPEERLAVFLPYLVFRPGSLTDPDGPNADPDAENSLFTQLFAESSYSISGKQLERLKNYIFQLTDACEATDVDPISITVYGFASDAPFLNGQRQPRPDSKTLNRHLANLRAAFVGDIIRRNASKREAIRTAIRVRVAAWDSFSEMARFRDRHAFRSFQFAISEYTDHRSAMLFLDDPARCPSITPGVGVEHLQASTD